MRCTPRVFERIDVNDSPERIRALWRLTKDPTYQFLRHVKRMENVPCVRKSGQDTSRFPWIHLLTQVCVSTHAVWREHDYTRTDDWWKGRVTILGSFADEHQAIRSVHFALPRSPPRSFSRGIRNIKLVQIRFRRFEDLTHLVCELPDLETLTCAELSFDALPTELPRRRPRSNRNPLRNLDIGDLEPHQWALPLFGVYLSVYDIVSFFSQGEIAVIVALLQLFPNIPYHTLVYYSRDDNTRALGELIVLQSSMGCTNWAYHVDRLSRRFRRVFRQEKELTILSIQFSENTIHNYTSATIVIDCRFAKIDPEHPSGWTRLHMELSKIRGLSRHSKFTFGFRSREDMTDFAETILEKMPSIIQHATVRYGIHEEHEDKVGHRFPEEDRWYRASLDSQELTGMIFIVLHCIRGHAEQNGAGEHKFDLSQVYE